MWQKGQKRASIWVRVQGIKSMDFQVVSKVQGLEDLEPPFRPRKKVIFQLGTASAHLAVEAAQLVCDLMVKRGIKRWCFMMRIYRYTSLYIISLYIIISPNPRDCQRALSCVSVLRHEITTGSRTIMDDHSECWMTTCLLPGFPRRDLCHFCCVVQESNSSIFLSSLRFSGSMLVTRMCSTSAQFSSLGRSPHSATAPEVTMCRALTCLECKGFTDGGLGNLMLLITRLQTIRQWRPPTGLVPFQKWMELGWIG